MEGVVARSKPTGCMCYYQLYLYIIWTGIVCFLLFMDMFPFSYTFPITNYLLSTPNSTTWRKNKALDFFGNLLRKSLTCKWHLINWRMGKDHETQLLEQTPSHAQILKDSFSSPVEYGHMNKISLYWPRKPIRKRISTCTNCQKSWAFEDE